jgi:hypothetical protein
MYGLRFPLYEKMEENLPPTAKLNLKDKISDGLRNILFHFLFLPVCDNVSTRCNICELSIAQT